MLSFFPTPSSAHPRSLFKIPETTPNHASQEWTQVESLMLDWFVSRPCSNYIYYDTSPDGVHQQPFIDSLPQGRLWTESWTGLGWKTFPSQSKLVRSVSFILFSLYPPFPFFTSLNHWERVIPHKLRLSPQNLHLHCDRPTTTSRWSRALVNQKARGDRWSFSGKFLNRFQCSFNISPWTGSKKRN